MESVRPAWSTGARESQAEALTELTELFKRRGRIFCVRCMTASVSCVESFKVLRVRRVAL